VLTRAGTVTTSTLGQFLKLAERGRIPRGSYLVIENLDRLSREDERKALRLWMDILDAGIHIVQLKPEKVFRHEKSDMIDVLHAIIEMSRGHGESEVKSYRVGAAWKQKRAEARANGSAMTKRLPAWVELVDGELRLIPERAAVVKRIFHLAATGCGHVLILKALLQDKVPAFGEYKVNKGRKRSAFKGEWTRPYIALILKDRRALGELQPKLQGGKPDGDPIPNYYPAAITEAERNAARAATTGRGCKPVRTNPSEVNLFGGLLRDARSGESYYSILRIRPRSGERERVLCNKTAERGKDKCYSFPQPVFERAVLGYLKEIDPHSILNGDSGPDESASLAAELGAVEAKIAELEEDLLTHKVNAVARVLEKLEQRQAALNEKLARARQQATHPLSESWGETQSLVEALATAPDPLEARLRLRLALRRILESVWVLVVPRGKYRICEVQLFFRAGEKLAYRIITIFFRQGVSNAWSSTPARWAVLTQWQPRGCRPGIPQNIEDHDAPPREDEAITSRFPGTFDLRKPEQAEIVRRNLEEYPLDIAGELLEDLGQDL
jgi:DNA invertase Pin-like site-specific DNA recombinase